jgi:hypothetical protein
MAQESVVGVYDTMDQAEAAVRQLDGAKFPVSQVSIIATHLQSEKQVHGFVTSCDVAKQAAGTGAWLGGIFGLLVGAAFIWVPGVGPLVVAGSLTAALLGAAEGAVGWAAVSGLVGWLSALGISKEHILKYEEVLKAGKFLVIAHGEPADVAKARAALETTGPKSVDSHAGAA